MKTIIFMSGEINTLANLIQKGTPNTTFIQNLSDEENNTIQEKWGDKGVKELNYRKGLKIQQNFVNALSGKCSDLILVDKNTTTETSLKIYNDVIKMYNCICFTVAIQNEQPSNRSGKVILFIPGKNTTPLIDFVKKGSTHAEVMNDTNGQEQDAHFITLINDRSVDLLLVLQNITVEDEIVFKRFARAMEFSAINVHIVSTFNTEDPVPEFKKQDESPVIVDEVVEENSNENIPEKTISPNTINGEKSIKKEIPWGQKVWKFFNGIK